MQATQLKINFQRLKADILALAEIGKSSDDRGIYRMAFTDADMQARAWLESRIVDGGLEYASDGAANQFGKLGASNDRPSILMGSHIDSVPAAGHLDGTLGVLTALECLRSLREAGVQTKYGLEMIAFSDEEGRFGGLLGSESLAGEITPERIHNAVDLGGVTLIEAMKAHGLNAMDALQARRSPETIRSYLELHIEQGPVLDRLGQQVGVVEHITGLFKWSIRLLGNANHAGTTPMHMRRDAFHGLAEFSGEIPRILEEHGGENSVATIGRVDLFPGTANTVPGRVEFSLDCRDTSEEVLEALADAFRRALSAIARRRDLMFEFDVLSQVRSVACDPDIVRTVAEAADALGLRSHRMPSGAVHDAQIMARVAAMGMIFVPSKDGRSHNPAEWTHWEDIEAGANLALQTLLKLSEAG
ncbi:MAG: Zn-dependent hydrolase [Leptospirales bacterium]|jgi:N-carbamoyl-L-amino-acid hydrolase